MRRREFLGVGGAAAVAARGAGAAAGRAGRRMSYSGPSPQKIRKCRPAWRRSCRVYRGGWEDGRNLQIEYRLGTAGDVDRIRRYAAELVALAPDVIFVAGAASMGPLLQATRTVPIVFSNVPDPVGAGFVDSMARPGGNATGFPQFEYGLGGKWLELLKEIAPQVTRAAVLRMPPRRRSVSWRHPGRSRRRLG